jgi:hypothetical protein
VATNSSTPLRGPNGRLYAEPQISPDEKTFRVDNTSSEYYNSPYFLANKNQVERIPARRNDLPLNLADFVPQQVADAIHFRRRPPR